MKRICLAVVLLMVLAGYSYGAGTCVQTAKNSETYNKSIPNPETVIITLVCTADVSDGTYPAALIPMTAGSVSSNTYNLYGYYLYQIWRIPGSPAPTANYTVTVTDINDFALDLGLLAGNGSATVPQYAAIYNSATSFPVVGSSPTVAITGNSVNSAVITLDLVFKAK